MNDLVPLPNWIEVTISFTFFFLDYFFLASPSAAAASAKAAASFLASSSLAAYALALSSISMVLFFLKTSLSLAIYASKTFWPPWDFANCSQTLEIVNYSSIYFNNSVS